MLHLQVTYLYYLGVFAFLREDYPEAEGHFLKSLQMTHVRSPRNIECVTVLCHHFHRTKILMTFM